MIDHKLAKQLKDTGFPQEYHDCVGDRDGNCVCVEPITFPTLSELIEACRGVDFILHCYSHGYIVEKKGSDAMRICEEADVAVAKLYLSLKKKQN